VGPAFFSQVAGFDSVRLVCGVLTDQVLDDIATYSPNVNELYVYGNIVRCGVGAVRRLVAACSALSRVSLLPCFLRNEEVASVFGSRLTLSLTELTLVDCASLTTDTVLAVCAVNPQLEMFNFAKCPFVCGFEVERSLLEGGRLIKFGNSM
jgi:hypothetical protein